MKTVLGFRTRILFGLLAFTPYLTWGWDCQEKLKADLADINPIYQIHIFSSETYPLQNKGADPMYATQVNFTVTNSTTGKIQVVGAVHWQKWSEIQQKATQTKSQTELACLLQSEAMAPTIASLKSQ